MPYQTVFMPKEVFLTHQGLTVYHAYKDDDFDRPLSYWYSLDEADPAEDFDVRDLKTWDDADDDVEFAIKRAIESGELSDS